MLLSHTLANSILNTILQANLDMLEGCCCLRLWLNSTSLHHLRESSWQSMQCLFMIHRLCHVPYGQSGLQPSVLQTACSGSFGLPIACCPVPLDLRLCKSVTLDQHALNNKLLRLQTRIRRLFAYRIHSVFVLLVS